MPFFGLLTAGIGVAGSIGGALIGGHAAGKAADQQAQSAREALDYTKQVEAPYVNAGNTSIAKLMEAIQNGTFGPGSLPSFQAPSAFKAPTAEEARATPGYQFALDQGELGISRQAAAAGGAFTGGTIKAGSQFATGLAEGTYGDTFNRAFSTHQSQFNDALSSYQAQLAKQAQEYQQLITPATIGANAASGTSTNVANLMTQIGNAQASGTIGTANAISSGISGGTNGITQALTLQKLLSANGGTAPPQGWGGTPGAYTPPAQSYIPPTGSEWTPPAQGYIPG